MRVYLSCLVMLACGLSLADAQRPEESGGLPPIDFSQSYLSLPPGYFPAIPSSVAEWLEVRHCWIAQPHVYEYFGSPDSAYPMNVSRGNYDGNAPDDWAFIIDYRRKLYLAVIWDGNPEKGELIALDSLGYDINFYNRDLDSRRFTGILGSDETYKTYKGYDVWLNRQEPGGVDGLNEKIDRGETVKFRAKHDALNLFGTTYNSDEFYPMLYWDGDHWQCFGGGDAVYSQKQADWEHAIRKASSIPPVNFYQDTLCLLPSMFKELPATIRAWLEERQYRIPQVHELELGTWYRDCFIEPEMYNVISGNFNGTGELDWVVVAFRQDTLKAFIFWDSIADLAEELGKFEIDKGYYQSDYPYHRDDISYRSFLYVAYKVQQEWLDEAPYRDAHLAFEDSKPLPMFFTHDGFLFASTEWWDGDFIRYFHEGEWLYINNNRATLRATRDSSCYIDFQ